jgi:hypothetical protein
VVLQLRLGRDAKQLLTVKLGTLRNVSQGCGLGLILWQDLAQRRDRWWALANEVMNIRVPQNASNFLTNLGPVSFPGMTLHHGVSCWVTFVSIQHNYIPDMFRTFMWSLSRGKHFYQCVVCFDGRSWWPWGLRRMSAAAWLLGLWVWTPLNLETPNVNYSWRTAPLTSKVAFCIFIQQI